MPTWPMDAHECAPYVVVVGAAFMPTWPMGAPNVMAIISAISPAESPLRSANE